MRWILSLRKGNVLYPTDRVNKAPCQSFENDLNSSQNRTLETDVRSACRSDCSGFCHAVALFQLLHNQGGHIAVSIPADEQIHMPVSRDDPLAISCGNSGSIRAHCSSEIQKKSAIQNAHSLEPHEAHIATHENPVFGSGPALPEGVRATFWFNNGPAIAAEKFEEHWKHRLGSRARFNLMSRGHSFW